MGEDVPFERLQWSPDVHEEGPELRQIKKEQVEPQSSQRCKQLSVRSGDGEEETQQLQQSKAVLHIKIEADEEDHEGLELIKKMNVLVKQRLTAAVKEIFGFFETSLAEYEEEIKGFQKMLEKAGVQVNTAGLLRFTNVLSPPRKTSKLNLIVLMHVEEKLLHQFFQGSCTQSFHFFNYRFIQSTYSFGLE